MKSSNLRVTDIASPVSTFRAIPIDEIAVDPSRMRKSLDSEGLELLAENIKEHGVLQPIVVRQSEGNYLLVAGERRWRAAKMAGLESIQAIVRDDISEKERMKEISFIENMHREDLGTAEELTAISDLLQRGKTVREVSILAGRSERHVRRARDTSGFFDPMLKGNPDARREILEACRRHGIHTLWEVAKAGKETKDVTSAMELLKIDSAAAVEKEAKALRAKHNGQGAGKAMSPGNGKPSKTVLTDTITFKTILSSKVKSDPGFFETLQQKNGAGGPVAWSDSVQPFDDPAAFFSGEVSGKGLVKIFSELKRYLEALRMIRVSKVEVEEPYADELRALLKDVESLVPSINEVAAAVRSELATAGGLHGQSGDDIS